MSSNSFDAKATLSVGDRSYEIFRLDALQAKYDVARLPFSLKILLENLLRNEDGESIRAQDIEALAKWNAERAAQQRDRVHARRACSCRTSPACPPSSTWRRCATRCGTWAATRTRSTRWSRRSSSSTTPCRSTCSARAPPSSATPSSSSSETASATRSCAGARARLTTSRSSRPTPASSTRSTSSTSRAWCSSTRASARPIRTRSSAPTRTRRWSTGWACSAGASAGSRPRRRCSASRCRC